MFTVKTRLRLWNFLAFAICPLLASAQAEPSYTIRVSSELVQISVVVKDRAGQFVRGLDRKDFELLENGQRQELVAVDVEAVRARAEGAQPLPPALPLLTSTAPLQSSSARGLRLVVLFFDLTSLELDDTARAIRAAEQYVRSLGASDRVAVVSLASDVRVQQDFTAEAAALSQAIARVRALAQAAAAPPPEEGEAGESGYDIFSEDRRLRSLRLICNLLRALPQKKSIVIFARAAGSAGDNHAGLTATVNDAVLSGVSIYAIDASGLQASPPLGDATRGSSYGTAVLSGQAVVAQGAEAVRSQDMLYALARGTGGHAFFDSNDFERPFRMMNDDTREYYLLSYRSSNRNRDGRFRRVAVRVRRAHLQVAHQAGYYAPSKLEPATGPEREGQFQAELASDLPAVDLPVTAALAWARMAADKFYVPITVLLPLSALAEQAASGASLEIAAFFREKGGRAEQRLRETIKLQASVPGQTVARVFQYNGGAVLPAGEYKIRVLVRENSTGKMGAFDGAITLAEAPPEKLTIAPILAGWKTAVAKPSDNPLVTGGYSLVPNPVGRYATTDTVAFRYELSTPPLATAQAADALPALKTALQCFRGRETVFSAEPALKPQSGSNTAVAQVEIPPGVLAPGDYTCQASAVESVRGQFAFARTHLAIRTR